MRKLFLIMVSNLVLLNGCFAIDALQLKNARVGAYQWIRDYDLYSQLNAKRSARSRFLALFQSGDVIVVNEYLPLLNEKGTTIKVSDLADLIMDKSSRYKMFCTIDSVYLTEENVTGSGTVEYRVMLRKSIRFADRNSYEDTCVAYPNVTVSEVATLRYDVVAGSVVAVSITSEDMIENVHVLHNAKARTLDSVNVYVPASFVENVRNTGNPFVTAVAMEDARDPQVLTVHKDTMKANFHFGGGVGVSFYSAEINQRFTNFTRTSGLSYTAGFGFYTQFTMKGKNRFGMEYDVRFNRNMYGISANYDANYDDVDEDEHNYEDARSYRRYVDIDDYKEVVKRYAAEIPIAFRYDRLVHKNVSVFVKLGAAVSYDVITKSSATAVATYYGVYDWMGGIRIDDYERYGFGKYQLNEGTSKLSIDKLGVSVFAGVGAQVFIARRWSMDFGVYYTNVVYNSVKTESDYYLTKRNQNYPNRCDVWTTATAALSKFNASNVNFQVMFNYNF